jgi:hypothetical protein
MSENKGHTNADYLEAYMSVSAASKAVAQEIGVHEFNCVVALLIARRQEARSGHASARWMRIRHKAWCRRWHLGSSTQADENGDTQGYSIFLTTADGDMTPEDVSRAHRGSHE